jgi:hypothetical protein
MAFDLLSSIQYRNLFYKIALLHHFVKIWTESVVVSSDKFCLYIKVNPYCNHTYRRNSIVEHVVPIDYVPLRSFRLNDCMYLPFYTIRKTARQWRWRFVRNRIVIKQTRWSIPSPTHIAIDDRRNFSMCCVRLHLVYDLKIQQFLCTCR